MQGFTSNATLRAASRAGEAGLPALHRPDQFVTDVFMDSDTDLMVLAFVPSTREASL